MPLLQRSQLPALSALLLGLGGLLLGACGGDGGTPPVSVDCDAAPVTTLAAGAHTIVTPAAPSGCLRLPAAGPAGAEYFVAAYSANGQEAPSGVQGAFTLKGVSDPAALTALRAAFALPARGGTSEPEAFHRMLRTRERELSRHPELFRRREVEPRLRVPPQVGDQKNFEVCKTASCAQFVTVQATAQYVAAHTAIFLDDTVPAGGFTAGEITALGDLFEQQLYAIDTTAFGRESDIDGNGVVQILLTDRVNALSPNCSSTGQIIVGYFFGNDLAPGSAHSNQGEVFYGLVPDPSKPICSSKARVLDLIAPTMIHEFQHMISFNRHVLLGGGVSEETWLNEGLSHYAEELGGRQVPGGSCTGGNCLDQFAVGNLVNAYDYLTAPAGSYLVEPGTSSGTLEERGANWLFVRWFADQSPTDSLLGTDLTRRLTGADQPGGITAIGGANVAAAAQLFQVGVSFATLAGEWHLANYGEPAGLVEPSGRLRFRSWDLVSAFDQILPGPYPLRVDSTSGAGYLVSGTLRGGSGTYLRVVQPADGLGIALGLTVKQSATILPRYAVVRIR